MSGNIGRVSYESERERITSAIVSGGSGSDKKKKVTIRD
jgi:hypothetical protein